MTIDPEVISPPSKKGTKASGYSPKWVIYRLGGLGVLILVGLIKTLFTII